MPTPALNGAVTRGNVQQPDAAPPNALRVGTIHRLGGWQRLAFLPAAWSLDAYYRMLRVRLAPEQPSSLQALSKHGILVIAWHNRSLLFPLVVRRLGLEPVHTLISASRMAAWEAAYFERRGLPAIRGSSTRGGSVAVRESLRVLRDGGNVALSPDGPSGPLYSFQRGAAVLARRHNGPVLLIGINAPRARRLRTWDRHLVPWPGQEVEVQLRFFERYADLRAADDGEASERLRISLLEINDH